LPIKKNFSGFAHSIFSHNGSLPIGLKILVAPLKIKSMWLCV